MAPLYSHRFLQLSVANVVLTYTVPLGSRAVIRCVTMVSFNTSGATVYVKANGADVLFRDFQARTSVVYGDLRAVVYGGEEMSVQMSGQDVHCIVSGYLFTDPAQGKAPDADAEAWPPEEHLEPYVWQP